LKLGYSRAARIIDQLEELGILGPFEGSKPRQILMTKERWRELQYTKGGVPADSFLIEPDDFDTEANTAFKEN
jgi:S-DNA-T family DNA segregation ATPase FtsK/SpoIIIE